MPRPVLKHEKKIIEEMLADSGLPQFPSPHTFQIPKTVDRIHMDDDPPINAGSMIIFRRQEGTVDCKVISCHSLFPRTVVGELYITAGALDGQLAFLELVAWLQMPRRPVQFLTSIAWKFCSENLEDLPGDPLSNAMGNLQLFSTTRSRRTTRALERLRIAYIGSSVCFMFSQALSVFVNGGRELCSMESPDGSVQVLCSTAGELAIDGWCRLSKDRWDHFCEKEKRSSCPRKPHPGLSLPKTPSEGNGDAK